MIKTKSVNSGDSFDMKDTHTVEMSTKNPSPTQQAQQAVGLFLNSVSGSLGEGAAPQSLRMNIEEK